MISKRLIELRREKGLGRKEVAEALGINYSTYANYEQGLRNPRGDLLIKICNLYDVSTDYILGKTDDPMQIEEPQKGSKEWLLLGILDAAKRKGITELDDKTVNKILKIVNENLSNEINTLLDIFCQDVEK